MDEGTGTECLDNRYIDVWSKQVDSYHHYQSMAQKFIAVLTTGIAIIVSVTIGAFSIPSVRSTFSKGVNISELAQGLPVTPLQLSAIWIISSFITILFLILAAICIYDSYRLLNSVLTIESPLLAKQTPVSIGQKNTTSESRTVHSMKVSGNIDIIDEMKRCIAEGNVQAKRGLLSVVSGIVITVYSIRPNHNIAIISIVITLVGIYLVYQYNDPREIESEFFPKTDKITISLITALGLFILMFSGAISAIWIIAVAV